jgi:hypothetical protein
VLLYIERWLKAPMQMEDGSVVPRTAGRDDHFKLTGPGRNFRPNILSP